MNDEKKFVLGVGHNKHRVIGNFRLKFINHESGVWQDLIAGDESVEH